MCSRKEENRPSWVFPLYLRPRQSCCLLLASLFSRVLFAHFISHSQPWHSLGSFAVRRCCHTLVMRFVCLRLVRPVHCSVICLFSLVMFAFHLLPSENLCRCRKQRRIFLSLHTLYGAFLFLTPPCSSSLLLFLCDLTLSRLAAKLIIMYACAQLPFSLCLFLSPSLSLILFDNLCHTPFWHLANTMRIVHLGKKYSINSRKVRSSVQCTRKATERGRKREGE